MFYFYAFEVNVMQCIHIYKINSKYNPKRMKNAGWHQAVFHNQAENKKNEVKSSHSCISRPLNKYCITRVGIPI